jgi:hypothetical protein
MLAAERLGITFANQGDAPVPGEPIHEAYASAELRTACEVKAFEPRKGGGFRIAYRKHATTSPTASPTCPLPGEREQPETDDPLHIITADRLILAAGELIPIV